MAGPRHQVCGPLPSCLSKTFYVFQGRPTSAEAGGSSSASPSFSTLFLHESHTRHPGRVHFHLPADVSPPFPGVPWSDSGGTSSVKPSGAHHSVAGHSLLGVPTAPFTRHPSGVSFLDISRHLVFPVKRMSWGPGTRSRLVWFSSPAPPLFWPLIGTLGLLH